MKQVKCKCCGFTKEIEIRTMQDYIDNGFEFIWDVSTGLTNINFCEECASKIKEHIHAIEDIVGIRIDYLNLGTMSEFED
jgi:hypothetical protein